MNHVPTVNLHEIPSFIPQKEVILVLSATVMIGTLCMGLDATKPSSGFQTERYSNQSPQLHRLDRKFVCSKFRFDTFQ